MKEISSLNELLSKILIIFFFCLEYIFMHYRVSLFTNSALIIIYVYKTILFWII